jgi:hypothetical protein
MSIRIATLLTALVLLGCPLALAGATITVNNVDLPGEGFNDPTPVEPVGQNPGVTLGEQRLIVFQFAADLWGSLLESDVEIVVQATYREMPCTAGSALLASAGSVRILADFPGAPHTDTWYQPALANKLAGYDLTPGGPDPGLLVEPFNDDMYLLINLVVDTDPVCLGGVGWYYGLDNNAGAQIDLLNVAMHEMAHGLGFANFVNESTGAGPGGLTDAYSRLTYDTAMGKHWHEMTDAERVVSATSPGHVVWAGDHVRAQAPFVLGPRPVLKVMPPAASAGMYEVTTATFGAPVVNEGTMGELMLADDAVGVATDACEPLIGNFSDTIVLADRGACAFTTKAAHAQAAGAIGVVVINNQPLGLPPMTGQDDSIVITSVGMAQDDGLALKMDLPGVQGEICFDETRLAGTDEAENIRLFANTTSGSAISHWDLSAVPNLLMEPVFHPDLKARDTVDLTSRALADLGWDECPDSDFTPDVMLDQCDPEIANQVMNNGCTINDVLSRCFDGNVYDRRCVDDASRILVDDGVITNPDKVALKRCVKTKTKPGKKPPRTRPTGTRGRSLR